MTSALRFGAVGALCAVCLWGCGDAYSTHVPEQRTIVPMALEPTWIDVAETQEAVAYVFTPNETHFVVAQPDFGPNIAVEFDSGAGKGCEQAPVLPESAVPRIWPQTHVFPVCLTLIPQGGLTPGGTRTVSIEVDSDGTLVTAQHSPFFVVGD